MKLAFALSVIVLSCSFTRAADLSLRAELERTYNTWRAAVAARDFPGWQRSTASYRQMATRNLIVSQRQPFPDALFNLPMRPAEIATLRFLQEKTAGNTASLAYFGKVDLGLVDISEVPENILVLKFVNESTGWKFDTMRLLNLEGSLEIRTSLKNGGTRLILDDPDFAPDGIVPSTAKPCPPPDRIGVLQVASFGYSTRATVNGFEVATVKDNAEEHIVIGGLNDGENPLIIEAEEQPISEGAERHLEVNALVLTGEEKRPMIRVFEWKPAEGLKLNGPVKLTIIVSKITMR